jgi:2-polyprenyl-3-methyl-5-hydroxy-6-metoxy-1,4-benzoquinol methylase
MNKYSQNFYDSVSNRAVQSAQIAARVIAGTFQPTSIVDIGSGQGVWLNTIAQTFPSVKRAVALDLQSHQSVFFDDLHKSSVEFQFVEVNFEVSRNLPEENFDIAICLEVLEHLSTEAATEVAKEMGEKCSVVIFSAALLGQGGTGHINERKFSYWMNLMREQGFVALDVFRPALQKSTDVPGYYKQNMMLFWHPENSIRNDLKINLELLLIRNPLQLMDIRSATTKIRYALVALIPSGIVTALVKVLDKTIRKTT